MLISIVLSFRNEQETIPELINRLHNSLGPLKINYELIFVNDASTDNSLGILMEKAKNDKHIKIINMSRRFGYPACVIAGMKHSRGDAVIYMDADLQDPPEVIPQLIKEWQNGAEVVHTTRIAREGESAIKMWITKWAYRFLRFSSEDIDLPLDSGDFKLLDRRIVNELLKLKEKEPFIRGLVTWLGFKQVQVYYKREKRFGGKTHFPLFGKGPLKEFIRSITSFSFLPLYLSLLLGFFVSLGSLIYLIIVVINKMHGANLLGWSAIMVTMLFLGGTILFTIGVIGIYIGRIYDQVKGRPMYIVKDKIGFEND